MDNSAQASVVFFNARPAEYVPNVRNAFKDFALPDDCRCEPICRVVWERSIVRLRGFSHRALHIQVVTNPVLYRKESRRSAACFLSLFHLIPILRSDVYEPPSLRLKSAHKPSIE